MNRPHFRRRGRAWREQTNLMDPNPEYSRLDRLDGLGTRYDAEWPSVVAAEAPGGDLAAMAAPWPGMARDDLGTYAEPVEPDPLYQVGPDGLVTVLIEADLSRFRDEMAHAARTVAELTEPVMPRGRHRQTDPLDLILADLRDLDGL